jgi:3-hydroxyacyl-[acyl-carrier-protein] dehydratase
VRYLLLDRITRMEPPERASGIKCVSLSDDALADHFPGRPLFPGALVIEAMAQLSGALLEESAVREGHGDRLAVLAMVDRARFRRPIAPGDRIELEVMAQSRKEEIALVRARAVVDGELAAEAELGFAMAADSDAELCAERARLRALWIHGTSRR